MPLLTDSCSRINRRHFICRATAAAGWLRLNSLSMLAASRNAPVDSEITGQQLALWVTFITRAVYRRFAFKDVLSSGEKKKLYDELGIDVTNADVEDFRKALIPHKTAGAYANGVWIDSLETLNIGPISTYVPPNCPRTTLIKKLARLA
jgi:hypothetical protein